MYVTGINLKSAMSPLFFVSCAKPQPAKSSEKGYGDENERPHAFVLAMEVYL